MKTITGPVFWLLMFLGICSQSLWAQNTNIGGSGLNLYKRVSSINYCNSTITVVSGTTGYDIGDKVMLIQMKGATIDNSNTASYGDITAINNAGRYEFGIIASKTISSVTLKLPIVNNYDVTDGFVQLVKVAVYNTPTVTVTTNITCSGWSRTTGVGGIIVIDAPNSNLVLNADISADGRGFSRGLSSANGLITGCNTDYFFPSGSIRAGEKGEGIARANLNEESGRGKLANGGGGGNEINAGGAGGSNIGTGGNGGFGFAASSVPPCSTVSAPGENLVSYLGSSRIFLGGGGGGGHMNNSHNGHGGNGGGIIIIIANSIEGNLRTISANGNQGVDIAGGGSSDGAGGGGAGGSIFLMTNSFGSSTFYVQAMGGKGGDNDGAGSNFHGPGGGGGGGRIASKVAFTANVNRNANGNSAGVTSTGDHYGAAAGTAGIVDDIVTLPLSEIQELPSSIDLCAWSTLDYTVVGPSGYQYKWNGPGIAEISSGHLLVQPVTMANNGFFILSVVGPQCSTVFIIDTILVNVTVCCPLADSSLGYRIINAAAGPITADEIWDNKVYIRGGILEVQNNAVLDVTNVDVVFDECSGIRFTGGATIRANNSVFRPCEREKAWRGIEFRTAGNIVDECVFKNAVEAIKVLGEGTAKVHNNLFLNNGKGLVLVGLQNTPYSVSGNRFVIDNEVPSFATCGASNAYYMGIYSISTDFKQNISQNSFINNNTVGLNNFFAISLYEGYANFTANTFTNVYRAIDISVNTGLCNIENNKVEITRKIAATDMYMMNLTDGLAPVFVFNNEISDPNHYVAGSKNSAAIYVNAGVFLYVKNNSIKGFETGIEIYNTVNSLVTENHILNAGYGIYNESCNELEISCNEIDLDFETNIGACVGIYTNNMAQGRIHSNCILDTKVAMQFITPNQGSALPYIRNNFMYNYVLHGIHSDGYTGNIGGPTQTGRNTFYSNSAASDITNVTPAFVINSWSNFSVTIYSIPGVLISGGNSAHSTASCGRQTLPDGMMERNLDAELVCDNYELSIEPLWMDGGVFGLARNEPDMSGLGNSIFAVISSIRVLDAANPADARKVLDWCKASSYFSANEKLMAENTFLLARGRTGEAENLLSSFKPANSKEELWLQTERISLGLQRGVWPDEPQLDALRNMFAPDEDLINRANGILLYNNKVKDFYFKQKTIVKAGLGTSNPAQRILNMEKPALVAYPNPASNLLNLLLSIPADVTPVILVTDLAGREVLKQPINLVGGVFSIDISGLAPGSYLVHLPSEKGTPLLSRFVKN